MYLFFAIHEEIFLQIAIYNLIAQFEFKFSVLLWVWRYVIQFTENS